ncbi:MAG: pyruvate dehydrogenase (acetyl-transferring) E1 component subunit alpha [Solirubrobacterales bacterium]
MSKDKDEEDDKDDAPGTSDLDPPEQQRHDLPDEDTCRTLFRTMALIRRFEEEAQRQYQRANIGGFLHLAPGEEGTIVGTASVMRDDDYLIGAYRTHGHVIARGMKPRKVMAELFGRVDGASRGRGGSMHMFDLERRFMGGYGIVGGHLPLAAGMGLTVRYNDTDEVVVCMFGDGASNTGNFGETMNMAALWDLPVLFLVENNLYGMGTSIDRHSAVTELSRKASGYGIEGERVDGMDVLAMREAVSDHIERVRSEGKPLLLESFTYRFRGHSAADPEAYREKEEVEDWKRERDPVKTFRERLVEDDVFTDEELTEIEDELDGIVDDAVEFANQSAEPDLDSLYDHLYVLGDQVKGWYALDERTPEPHPGEREPTEGFSDETREVAEAAAAYGGERQGGDAGGDDADSDDGDDGDDD